MKDAEINKANIKTWLQPERCILTELLPPKNPRAEEKCESGGFSSTQKQEKG